MFERIINHYPNARQNYQLAQNAFQYTMTVIEGSSNRLSTQEKTTEKGKSIIKRVNLMRKIPLQEKEYSREWIEEIAALALKYAVGNCCEKACTVFNYIYEDPEFNCSNLELFNNPFFDHFFTVLNRNPNTDPADPRTWNVDTIICDPWIEDRSYFVGEIDFIKLANNQREVINYLLPHIGSSGPLILNKDVLGKANGNINSLIVRQACMVLRTQFFAKKLVTYNTNVPVFYETWDLPQKKHYKKQQKQLEANRFFTGADANTPDFSSPTPPLARH
jgi:hypothetical protein